MSLTEQTLRLPRTQDKTWGVHIRLATLRTKRNWGVGDFTDLKNIANWAQSKRAGVISLEPLQAIAPNNTWVENSIVYWSRSFLSAAYIDVEVVPDYIESQDIQRHVLAPEFQKRLAELRAETILDLNAVLYEKMQIMQLCYGHFREEHLRPDTPRAKEFRKFQTAQGARLERYSLFRSLREKLELAGNKSPGWTDWPEAYRTPDSEGTKEFAVSNLEKIEYFDYLQWIVGGQLESARAHCREKHLVAGLLIAQPDLVAQFGPDYWGITTNKSPIFTGNSKLTNPYVHYVDPQENIIELADDPRRMLLVPLNKLVAQTSESVHSLDWRHRAAIAFEDVQDDETIDRIIKQLSKIRPQPQINFDEIPEPEPISALPESTYRFQFNKEFKFNDAIKLVPYLSKLGISHCYTSPLLTARPGSMHGYDIIDYKNLNPEIGTPDEFKKLSETLRAHNIGLIVDIVPNHMGIGKMNRWWMDVLENGPSSIFSSYFDIDWTPVKKELYGKVIVPVLGDSYGNIVKGGHLKIVFDQEQGTLLLRYYDNDLPLNPITYPMVLGNRLDVLKERLGKNNPDVMEYQSILVSLERLPNHMDTKGFTDRIREKQVQLKRLSNLCHQNAEVLEFIKQNLIEFETHSDDSVSLERMNRLLEAQAYRLVFWRVASDEINYRRFFDINDLAAVRTEDQRVFTEMHELIFSLMEEGKIDGLRIDHPDGLFDPAGYFSQLQAKASEKRGQGILQDTSNLTLGNDKLPVYIVVEKILAPFEHLEDDWAVHGTVGYDYLNSLMNIFVASENEHQMNETYETFIGQKIDYEQLRRTCKGLILDSVLSSELHMLAHRLSQIAEMNWNFRDFTLNSLRTALRNIVLNFPVYRTYVTPSKSDKTAKQYIDWAVRLAKRSGSTITPEVYDFVRNVLCLEIGPYVADYLHQHQKTDFEQAAQTFAMKFQQFTGPVMAKSVEDTLFYRYNRFVALNEVGGEPDRFGITLSSFHYQSQQRQLRRPYEMLGSSTHDTKRSEDVRARLVVLSELPKLWEQKVNQWARINRSRKTEIDGEATPDANDEYLIYQTIVGACPLQTEGTDWIEPFKARINQYVLKAARESKQHTSWINQNAQYEGALASFVDKIFASNQTNPFIDDLLQFHSGLKELGLLNSLAQTLIKFTSPGVPDTYQGNEVWDFSLVDPDNRRPVDFAKRARLLEDMAGLVSQKSSSDERKALLKKTLTGDYSSGEAKLLCSAVVLKARSECEGLFTKGRYLPLEVRGSGEANVIAYARELNGEWYVTVVPRFVASLLKLDDAEKFGKVSTLALNSEAFGDTEIHMPADFTAKEFVNLLDGEKFAPQGSSVRVSQVLKNFPVALIKASNPTNK